MQNQNKFEFIGFELDEYYYKLANKRLLSAQETQSLFNMPEEETEKDEQLSLEV